MKARLILSILVSLLISQAPSVLAKGGEQIRLDGQWTIQSAAKVKEKGNQISQSSFSTENWYPTTVPITVLAALVKNQVFPDPYYGDNLKQIPGYREGRWLVMPKDSPFRANWWYRKTFTIPKAYRNKHLTLHLDGINYKANVWLNGDLVADREQIKGMFRRFQINVDKYALPGKVNCLALEIISPGKLPDRQYRTKQLEATTGWDDHNPVPPDLNMGIWRDVYITVTGPVTIRYPYVASELEIPSLEQARLTVTAEVENLENRPLTGKLIGKVEDHRFSQSVSLSPREKNTITFAPGEYKSLTISHPRLWWPNPLGNQELYTLTLTFLVNEESSDSTAVCFGIRNISSHMNEEGWRQFTINGRKLLIRGGAWMTSDMLLRLSERRYDTLIRYAREANLNMLRSEGFSIRETDEFYDRCDQYGVMVTQQIFGRSIPDEQLAIDCVKDMILRIRNHPSLVHFLGHDETFPTDTLDQAYRKLIAKYIPDRTYQPHSGAFNLKDRFKTGGTRTGSREVWTYVDPSHYYVSKKTGAWGFAQSGGIGGVVAPIESVKRMMPAKDLWPLWSDMFSFHTVIQGARYFDVLRNALETRYGKPKNIQDFCLKGQIMNYESARGMFEAYGRNKFSATGITTWKYDAAWPAALTWQYVDWYGIVGGAYYGAKKACEPLHVQYAYDDNSVYVINNFYKPFAGLTVSATVYNFDMQKKWGNTARVSVDTNGKKKALVIDEIPGLSTTYFLKLLLTDPRGREISNNFYWLSTVPDIPGIQGYRPDRSFYIHPKSVADFTALQNLPKIRLDVNTRFEDNGDETVAQVALVNPSKNLAFCVHLAITQGEGGKEVAPTFWEENYFSLLPGEEKKVQGTFSTEDLEGTSPQIKVDGWNSTAG